MCTVQIQDGITNAKYVNITFIIANTCDQI